ncbi:MAG: hypothetical protein WCD47_13750 [Candidatus Sulfotelmatobacter sp.]
MRGLWHLTYLLENLFGERAALRLRDSVLESLNAAQERENDFAEKKDNDVPIWNDAAKNQLIQVFTFRFRIETALQFLQAFFSSLTSD